MGYHNGGDDYATCEYRTDVWAKARREMKENTMAEAERVQYQEKEIYVPSSEVDLKHPWKRGDTEKEIHRILSHIVPFSKSGSESFRLPKGRNMTQL